MFRVAVAITALWLASGATGQTVYKWIDEQGNVTYSDQPPPDRYKAEEARLESAPKEAEVRKSQEKLVRLQERVKRDQERRSEVRELNRITNEAKKAERVDRLRRCLNAREQMHNLALSLPVYYIDENGEWVFLDDAERADYIRHYDAEIAAFCS